MDKTAALIAVLQEHGMDDPPEGMNRPARCCYHVDTVKSATVSTDIGLYCCMTCSVQGDAISLMMQHEELSFRDAVARIESLVGAGSADLQSGSRAGHGGVRVPGRSGDRRDRRAYRPSWGSD